MEIYKKLPNDLKKIIDYYVHNLRLREIVLSINYISNCHGCEYDWIKRSNIFTDEYRIELGRIKLIFEIPYVCGYGFYN